MTNKPFPELRADKDDAPRPELSDRNDHPMVELPFTISVDDRRLKGVEMSLVSATATGLIDPAMENEVRLVSLRFDFDTFTFALFAEMRIAKISSGTGEVELVFTNPSGPHLPQLRYLLNARIAGDLIGVGSLIGLAPEKIAPAARPKPGIGFKIRRVLGTAMMAAVSLLLAFIVSTTAYQRFYAIEVPSAGTVVAQGTVLRAVSPGQLNYLNPEAREGDVAFAIQATSGEVLSVAMPCDCQVFSAGLTEGATVLMGDPILQITEAGAPMEVDVVVPRETLFDLASAETIELVFPDDRRVFADLARTQVSEPSDDVVPVTLRPRTHVSEEDLGALVEVWGYRASPAILEWLAGLSGAAPIGEKGVSK